MRFFVAPKWKTHAAHRSSFSGGFDMDSRHEGHDLVGGIPTPLKNMKVNWDDDIPNIWKKQNVPNHQPDEDTGTQYSVTLRFLCSTTVFYLILSQEKAGLHFTVFFCKMATNVYLQILQEMFVEIVKTQCISKSVVSSKIAHYSLTAKMNQVN